MITIRVVSSNWTANIDWENDVFGYRTSGTGYNVTSLATEPPTLVTGTTSLAFEPLAPIVGAKSSNIGSAALVVKRSHWLSDHRHRLLEWSLRTFDSWHWLTSWVNSHQIDDLATKWGRGSHCVYLENVLPNFQK